MKIGYLYSKERDGELRELAEKLASLSTIEEITEFVSQLPMDGYSELCSFIKYETERLKYENEKELNRKRELLKQKQELLKERESLYNEIEEKFGKANAMFEVFGEDTFLFGMGKA